MVQLRTMGSGIVHLAVPHFCLRIIGCVLLLGSAYFFNVCV